MKWPKIRFYKKEELDPPMSSKNEVYISYETAMLILQIVSTIGTVLTVFLTARSTTFIALVLLM